ncbi:LAQU0S05e05204g1_1 [Lachancea quebecensis]|uniref:LAQU0S05e05204g1_1 n=1 Tax=Lachancea quebecensis TaxID=1654605 RepID=A0A0N7MLJ1_9SACH|nr:LAQU0S05e05204g1_1 [Lachancea quebecensis]
MNSNGWSNVEWPNESHIRERARKNLTVDFVQKVFYNAGVVVSLAYVVIVSVVEPLLRSQIHQRLQLSADMLIRIRKFVSLLEHRLKSTSISAVGFNEKVNSQSRVSTVDRCMQTEDLLESNDAEKKVTGWTKVIARLQYAREMLNKANKGKNDNNASDRLTPLKFQAQSLNAYISSLDVRDETFRNNKSSVQAIRDMKGWVINGKVR